MTRIVSQLLLFGQLFIFVQVNPFQANVSIMEKPGGWFLPAKYVKNPSGRVTF